jgi:hypothetical protein
MPDRSRTTAPDNRPKPVPDAKASAELLEHVKRWRQLGHELDEFTQRLPRLLVGPAMAELAVRLSEFVAISAEFQKLAELYPGGIIDEVLRAEFRETASSFGALNTRLAKLEWPPVAACFLLDLLLAKADRKAIPGDLEEEFTTRLAKYGPTGARLWFWGETVRTIATRNPICRWWLVGGLVRIGEWILRMIGS